MKTYLVLDFAIRDLRGFLTYADAIPMLIEKQWRAILGARRPTDAD